MAASCLIGISRQTSSGGVARPPAAACPDLDQLFGVASKPLCFLMVFERFWAPRVATPIPGRQQHLQAAGGNTSTRAVANAGPTFGGRFGFKSGGRFLKKSGGRFLKKSGGRFLKKSGGRFLKKSGGRFLKKSGGRFLFKSGGHHLGPAGLCCPAWHLPIVKKLSQIVHIFLCNPNGRFWALFLSFPCFLCCLVLQVDHQHGRKVLTKSQVGTNRKMSKMS